MGLFGLLRIFWGQYGCIGLIRVMTVILSYYERIISVMRVILGKDDIGGINYVFIY